MFDGVDVDGMSSVARRHSTMYRIVSDAIFDWIARLVLLSLNFFLFFLLTAAAFFALFSLFARFRLALISTLRAFPWIPNREFMFRYFRYVENGRRVFQHQFVHNFFISFAWHSLVFVCAFDEWTSISTCHWLEAHYDNGWHRLCVIQLPLEWEGTRRVCKYV